MRAVLLAGRTAHRFVPLHLHDGIGEEDVMLRHLKGRGVQGVEAFEICVAWSYEEVGASEPLRSVEGGHAVVLVDVDPTWTSFIKRSVCRSQAARVAAETPRRATPSVWSSTSSPSKLSLFTSCCSSSSSSSSSLSSSSGSGSSSSDQQRASPSASITEPRHDTVTSLPSLYSRC